MDEKKLPPTPGVQSENPSISSETIIEEKSISPETLSSEDKHPVKEPDLESSNVEKENQRSENSFQTNDESVEPVRQEKPDHKFESKETESMKAQPPQSRKNSSLFSSLQFWRILSLILVVVTAFSLFQSFSKSSATAANEEIIEEQEEELDDLRDELDELESENALLSNENTTLNAKINDLENGPARQLSNIKTFFENGEWQKVVDGYNYLHADYNGSAQDKEAAEIAKQAQQKLDEAAAAKQKQEQEEAQRKAEEEARGYETGITYEQLARTPDDFIGQKVKFSGRVLQVNEGDTENDLRLAIEGNSDEVVLGAYSPSLVSSKILVDDWITIYGISMGDYTYTSIFNQGITVPLIDIEKIDQ